MEFWEFVQFIGTIVMRVIGVLFLALLFFGILRNVSLLLAKRRHEKVEAALTTSKTLEVVSKLAIPAGSIFSTPQLLGPLVIARTNAEEIWGVEASLELKTLLPGGLSITTYFLVDRAQYLSVAPGDEIPNPHFGEMKTDIILSPSVASALKTR